jgi:hypothetical protein
MSGSGRVASDSSVFRLTAHQPVADALQLPIDREFPALFVDAVPRQAKQFAFAQTKDQDQHPCRVERIVRCPSRLQESLGFLAVSGFPRLLPGDVQPHQCGDVLDEKFLRDSLTEGRSRCRAKPLDGATGRQRVAALAEDAGALLRRRASGVFPLSTALAGAGDLNNELSVRGQVRPEPGPGLRPAADAAASLRRRGFQPAGRRDILKKSRTVDMLADPELLAVVYDPGSV